MHALDRKLVRDLWRMKYQFAAIALVIGCGVAMIIMAWSMLSSLRLTLDTYYESHRFAHVFLQVERAPNSLLPRIAKIVGVGQVEGRVVEDVTLDLTGLDEPAIGRLVSLPDAPDGGLNRLYLRSGRFPRPRGALEVLVSEAFAAAHGLAPGDSLHAVLNGKRQRLNVVGVALSPEYVYQVRGGDLFPNDRTFGVFWMPHDELAAAFNMEGAFNDVVVRLSPQASEAHVIEELDQLVDGYGGVGAYGRDMQPSSRYLANELRELRNMGYFAPVIFLLVAAFLLNVVLSRVVGTQREQIAALKAFGFTPREIASHYVKMTMVVVLLGVAIGILAGAYLGHWMSLMYARFFHFPILAFRLEPAVVVSAGIVSMLAGLAGILMAIRRAVKLPPAAAMQPEPPSVYRPAIVERLGLQRLLSPATRMILRHLEHRPLTTLLTTSGLAAAVSVMVLGNFAADSVDSLIDFQFNRVQRYDVTVAFIEPTSRRVVHELEHLPGVTRVEVFRGAPAHIRSAHRARRQEIMALQSDSQLMRLLDVQGRLKTVPTNGLLLSSKLAELLQVGLGDEVQVQILEGRRPLVRLSVVALIDDMIGTSAYMHIDSLNDLLQEGDAVSGAFLAVDENRLNNLYRELKETPRAAGVSAKSVFLRSFRQTLGAMLLRMRAINVVFAAIIACGVVYNSATIAVTERSRDLASLRILGYSRAEISYILLGEMAVLTLVAIPVGLVLGYGLVIVASWGYDTELFRIPVVIYGSTYGWAVLTLLIAALLSALVVRRRLDRLNLIAVLKAKD